MYLIEFFYLIWNGQFMDTNKICNDGEFFFRFTATPSPNFVFYTRSPMTIFFSLMYIYDSALTRTKKLNYGVNVIKYTF